MSDNCRLCVWRGSLSDCIQDECDGHNDWYAQQMREAKDKAEAERDHYKAALSDLLQTVFIWVLDEPYFRTRGGIPMEIAERYVRVIHRAKHALEGKP